MNSTSPPFDLVQLSTLPEHMWKGRAVFHPSEQRGDVPVWEMSEEEFEEFLERFPSDYRYWQTRADYDVGVVLAWEPDPLFEELGIIRVQFIGPSGSSLRYASTNLWTPRPEEPKP